MMSFSCFIFRYLGVTTPRSSLNSINACILCDASSSLRYLGGVIVVRFAFEFEMIEFLLMFLMESISRLTISNSVLSVSFSIFN